MYVVCAAYLCPCYARCDSQVVSLVGARPLARTRGRNKGSADDPRQPNPAPPLPRRQHPPVSIAPLLHTAHPFAAAPVSSTAGMPPATLEHVTQFWFSDRVKPLQWKPTPEFDAEIRDTFSHLIAAELAAPPATEADAALPPAVLYARILLLDQFTRNIGRGTAAAFAGDAHAAALCKLLINTPGALDSLPAEWRMFAVLPLLHSEDVKDHEFAIKKVPLLLPGAWPNLSDHFISHFSRLSRWGRFPHRNKMLGRASTPEEEAHLSDTANLYSWEKLA